MDLGGLPQGGGEAGRVSGGRWAGLTMNRNGVGSVADLKKKRMWGTLKNFERTGIGRSKRRMVRRGQDLTDPVLNAFLFPACLESTFLADF